jgi:hypothetical protein
MDAENSNRHTTSQLTAGLGIRQPDLLTDLEVIVYLRLDTDGRNSAERLRNLIRRQGLPVIRRGKLRLFRRVAIDAWLDAGQRGKQRIPRASSLHTTG